MTNGSNRKKINLALQGGGAYGAFTWGVLDYMLEDGRLEIEGTVVELVDTAGLRPGVNGVEGQAQALGREQAEQADLVLLCLVAGQSATDDEAGLLSPRSLGADPAVADVDHAVGELRGAEVVVDDDERRAVRRCQLGEQLVDA